MIAAPSRASRSRLVQEEGKKNPCEAVRVSLLNNGQFFCGMRVMPCVNLSIGNENGMRVLRYAELRVFVLIH